MVHSPSFAKNESWWRNSKRIIVAISTLQNGNSKFWCLEAKIPQLGIFIFPIGNFHFSNRKFFLRLPPKFLAFFLGVLLFYSYLCKLNKEKDIYRVRFGIKFCFVTNFYVFSFGGFVYSSYLCAFTFQSYGL